MPFITVLSQHAADTISRDFANKYLDPRFLPNPASGLRAIISRKYPYLGCGNIGFRQLHVGGRRNRFPPAVGYFDYFAVRNILPPNCHHWHAMGGLAIPFAWACSRTDVAAFVRRKLGHAA